MGRSHSGRNRAPLADHFVLVTQGIQGKIVHVSSKGVCFEIIRIFPSDNMDITEYTT